MTVVEQMLVNIELPKMIKVRQIFKDEHIVAVESTLRAKLRTSPIRNSIKPRMKIAIGVGSRGLTDLPTVVKAVVSELIQFGAEPFIVPAMGSHGGATAIGQAELLAALGVTEETAGCPIRSSMDTVDLGTLPNGLHVFMDKLAMQADGIVVINRIKPHTSFSGPIESGLVKMITIGLGKHRGAEACHSFGFGAMATNILDMAKLKLNAAPFLFGVGTIENSYDKICRIEILPASEILSREVEMLEEAKSLMPRIRFNPADVLIVDCMGKEFSGTGMDPNITGRAQTPYVKTNYSATRMVVLELSEKSRGNSTGVGLADVCTRRLFNSIDLESTYVNHLTSTVLGGAKIPMIMETDKLAVQAAIRTCNAADPNNLRIVRIPNTLQLETIMISEALRNDAIGQKDIEIIEDVADWQFDGHGHLKAFGVQ